MAGKGNPVEHHHLCCILPAEVPHYAPHSVPSVILTKITAFSKKEKLENERVVKETLPEKIPGWKHATFWLWKIYQVSTQLSLNHAASKHEVKRDAPMLESLQRKVWESETRRQ